MHTTGTTTPEGIHQLAPGLGERRPMPPPSGGQFKLPAALQPPQEAEAALPGHKVDLTGSTPPAPGGFPPVQPQLDATRTAPQVILPPVNVVAHRAQPQLGPQAVQLPGSFQVQVPQSPQQAPAADWQAMTAAQPPSPLGFRPPAPAGYQSAPAHVPPGMVANEMQHAQLITQVVQTAQHAPQAQQGWPRQLGPYEVAPEQQQQQQRTAAPAVPWPPSPTTVPQTRPGGVVDFGATPFLPAHQQPVWQPEPQPAQLGTVVRLEGDPATVEAALGMLMMRGVRVTLVAG